ncbi:uncharacterized protein LOC110237503 [Exaiptasia diaphana]|uniref:G-protein coupled receptors family 2 profile 2 domain-containing protein n=1 Tax=Exaiptasia diaphana TaxID=2652724 RepID=A0A913X4G7_EXADI|nr:uncharacterized protein LOC110237503 [Exaiptasia diaphana]KXJ15291.1 hypothetical protein AC249_AIPGENE14683 [Exaiptasia diaphana]
MATREDRSSDLQMATQEVSSPAKSSYKNKTRPMYRVVFYLVHIVLICIASLPTVFFVYHVHQPEHHTGITPYSTRRPGLGHAFALNNSKVNSSRAVQRCNTPLVYDNVTKECFAPCEWTTMSSRTHSVYYALMAVGLWLPLFATIFILITWAKIESLRTFPHVIRFYIIITCIILSCCKMIPLRAGLKKSFCSETDRWSPAGMRSLLISIQGASCHYFTLCLSFWSTCFILNTYLVIVKGTRKLFESSVLIHFCQSIACWVVPAIIVAGCIYVKYPAPAYKIAFVDFMTAAPCGELLKYLAVTLPMQLTLGVSLCLLWSITWCIRRSRKDNTRHAIRADKDTQAMLRIERQFMVMTVVILLVVGVMLSVKTIKDYQLHKLIGLAQNYFTCLKHTRHCQEPDLMTPLYAAMIVSPGFLCMMFFFLLFMNKDCRQIWTSCFKRIGRLNNIAKPRADTTRSRCSSTLTFLGDRKLSDVLLRKDRVNQLKSSSTPDLVGAVKPSPLISLKKTQLSPLVFDNRPRSSSTPVRFSIADNDSNRLEFSHVTSVPHSIGYNQPLPTPPRFRVEIKINDGDSIQGNTQQRNSSLAHSDNVENKDSTLGVHKGRSVSELLQDPDTYTTSL